MKITFSLCTKSTHEDIKTVVWTVATAAMEDTCFRRRWGGCAVQSGATRNQVRTGTRFSSPKLTCTRSPKHAAVKSDGLWPNYLPLRVKAPCQSVCSGHLPTKRYFRSIFKENMVKFLNITAKINCSYGYKNNTSLW